MTARVWVVDDDRSVRFVLATALREAGYRVEAFASADDALAALQGQATPDLLFTDVRMPGDSGLVLLDRLKAAHPQLPVIVMSAYTDIASTAGAFRGGAHEFLSKPFDLDDAVALAARTLPGRDARHRDDVSSAILAMVGPIGEHVPSATKLWDDQRLPTRCVIARSTLEATVRSVDAEGAAGGF